MMTLMEFIYYNNYPVRVSADGVSTSLDESGVSHGVSDRNASRSSSDELSEEVVGGTLALRTQDENLVICPNSVAHGHMKKTVSGSYWCVNCQRYYQM